MKILQLCNKLPYPPKDGGSIATFNLSEGFAELDHEVTILSLNTSKHYVDLDKVEGRLPKNITIKAIDINTRINPFKALINLLFSKLPYNAVRFFSKKYLQELIKLLKNKEFDVIQIEGLYMSYYVPFIKKHSKALISYRSHNIEHLIWKRMISNTKSIIKRKYLSILSERIQQLEINFINQYDLLIPITQNDLDIINKFGNNKPTMVIPAGVNLQGYMFDRNLPYQKSLFFIGALDWIPNQEGILWFINNVFSKLVNEFPEIELHVAGRNAPKWIMKELMKKNIIFHGEIEDAKQFINNHPVMIVPLFSGSGMRVKIIEGMALGKLIVSTSIGAEGINYTNNENIIISDSDQDFYDALKNILKNDKLLKNIGENARSFVNANYNNTKLADSLVDFYKHETKLT